MKNQRAIDMDNLPSEVRPPTQQCILCQKIFTGWGNNSQPIKDGQCCDECNSNTVMPFRLRELEKDTPEMKFFGLVPCTPEELAIIKLKQKVLALKRQYSSPCCEAAIEVRFEMSHDETLVIDRQGHILFDYDIDSDEVYTCDRCGRDLANICEENLHEYASQLKTLRGEQEENERKKDAATIPNMVNVNELIERLQRCKTEGDLSGSEPVYIEISEGGKRCLEPVRCFCIQKNKSFAFSGDYQSN
jgi:hypothetical protein